MVAAAAAPLTRGRGRWPALLAVLPMLTAAVLVAYVFGEDSYRGNGISRWDAYRSPGGALGPMFVLSVGLMAAAAAVLAYAGVHGRAALLRATALAAGVTVLFLVVPTTLGFSLN